MIKYENDCYSCEHYCIGRHCQYYCVPHFYCDECGDENELYEYEDKQLCRSCLLDIIPKVKAEKRLSILMKPEQNESQIQVLHT